MGHKSYVPSVRGGTPSKLRHTGLAALIATGLLAFTSTASAVQLTILEWEGYISPDEAAFEAWARSQGKDIDLVFMKNPDGSPLFIGNADDVFDNLRQKNCDVTTPTHNYFQQEHGKLLHVLHAIDTHRLSNYSTLYSNLRTWDHLNGKDGRTRAVPLLGGSYALIYNADSVPAPSSWSALLLPEAKGRFTITDDQIEANIYQMALLAGVAPQNIYNYDRFTPTQLKETAHNLKTLVANAANFWSSMPTPAQLEPLSYATDYWFGLAAANKTGQNWKFADPVEGSTLWLDTIAIAKHLESDPEKLEAAYLLVDYMIGKEAQARIARDFGSVIVNPEARALLTQEQAKALPDETFFVKERLWHPLSARTRNGFKKMWADALTANGITSKKPLK